MNDAMIEAMSQFETPRPILRSCVGLRRHLRCRAGLAWGAAEVRGEAQTPVLDFLEQRSAVFSDERVC
jgi:hypothetical protein